MASLENTLYFTYIISRFSSRFSERYTYKDAQLNPVIIGQSYESGLRGFPAGGKLEGDFLGSSAQVGIEFCDFVSLIEVLETRNFL